MITNRSRVQKAGQSSSFKQLLLFIFEWQSASRYAERVQKFASSSDSSSRNEEVLHSTSISLTNTLLLSYYVGFLVGRTLGNSPPLSFFRGRGAICLFSSPHFPRFRCLLTTVLFNIQHAFPRSFEVRKAAAGGGLDDREASN